MNRVLAILLDSAEPSLIENWIEDGSLPVLRRLRQEGTYGRLASTADLLSGSVSASFYTGTSPANHGFYNYLVWNAQKMATELPDSRQMPLVPFWRSFRDGHPRPIVIDIPHIFAPSAPYNGLEVMGWSSHDSIVPFTAYPPEFGKRIRAKFGGPYASEEMYGAMSRRYFLSTRDESLNIIGKVTDLSIDLMNHEAWDFFIICYPGIHRAGHRILNLTNLNADLSPTERAEFLEALHRVYVACDQAIGRLLESAGPATTILVFSLHGMGNNHCLTWLLPEMLQRVLREDSSQADSGTGLLTRIRNLVPISWRHSIKARLPHDARHRLTAFWRDKDMDWSRTRAFSMLADVQGLIRVNLKGRESRGIVEPGAEYDQLCDQIMRGLQSYVDADSGEPVIEKIVRTDQIFHGKNLHLLPDLIVTWVQRPVSEVRAVASPSYGVIDWPTPGMHPDGRSGTHLSTGMLIASGPGIKSGTISGAHILDLAPTILTLLGQPVPGEMEGKPLKLTG